MIVLSFDQPHATLIATGQQTVVTYPAHTAEVAAGAQACWPDSHGNHEPGCYGVLLPSLVGQTVAIAATGAGAFATSPDPNVTWPVPVGDLPRNAIVGSARVEAVVPIVEWTRAHRDTPYPHISVGPSPQDVYDGVSRNRVVLFTVEDGIYVRTEHTDQLPFADFTPGRVAVIFEDAAPCEERCPACGTTGPEWAYSPAWLKCNHCQHRCLPIPYESDGPIAEWAP